MSATPLTEQDLRTFLQQSRRDQDHTERVLNRLGESSFEATLWGSALDAERLADALRELLLRGRVVVERRSAGDLRRLSERKGRR